MKRKRSLLSRSADSEEYASVDVMDLDLGARGIAQGRMRGGGVTSTPVAPVVQEAVLVNVHRVVHSDRQLRSITLNVYPRWMAVNGMPSWLVLYMDLSHDQMAYAAIIATLIFGAGFIGISGVVQSGISFDDAFEENAGGNSLDLGESVDTDGDGLTDIIETTIHGTDPTDADTDQDGLSDGWEIDHGLNPLDNGQSDDLEAQEGSTPESEASGEEENSWRIQRMDPTVIPMGTV